MKVPWLFSMKISMVIFQVPYAFVVPLGDAARPDEGARKNAQDTDNFLCHGRRMSG
jgi:hypothetical protein